jgi:hypothetical protein
MLKELRTVDIIIIIVVVVVVVVIGRLILYSCLNRYRGS